MKEFDVKGARDAGYSEKEIAEHLAQQKNFDLSGARESGYKDDEIVKFLSTGKGFDPGSWDTGFVRGAYTGLAKTAGAPVDLINWGLGAVGLDSEKPVMGSDWLIEKGKGATLPSGAPLTYESMQDLPPSQRPFAAGGEVMGQGTPMAFLPITAAVYGKNIPSFVRPITDAAKASPRAFLSAEMGGLAGAAQGAGIAEVVFPGSDVARLTGEVAGGLANPVRLAATAGKRAFEGAGTFVRSFTRKGREQEVAELVQSRLIEMGEDPEFVAQMLTKTDLPGVDLTSGQKSGSRTLIGMEKDAAAQNPKFAALKQAKGEKSISALRALADELEASGDPEALRIAAKVRSSYFDELLSARFNKAQAQVNEAMAAFSGNKQAASIRANKVLEDALQDARKVENELWGNVDKSIEVSGEGIRNAYADLRQSILKEESLPSVVEGFVKRISKDGKISSGEAQRFRSRMLALARDARGKGEWDQARQFSKMADGAYDDLASIDTPEAQKAREYSYQLNEAFTRTFANDALGVKETGAARIEPEALLEKAFSGGGTTGDVRMRQLEGAAAFAGKSMASEQEEFLRAAAGASRNPETGKVNTVQLQKFLNDNQQLLDRFPTLKKELSDAGNAERLFKEVEAMGETASKQIARRAAFTKLSGTEKPSAVIGEAVNSATPEQAYSQFVKLAQRGGPEAVNGLKVSTLDYATQKATSQDGVFSFAKYSNELLKPVKKNGPSLLEMMERQGVMSKGESTRLRAIIKRAAEIEIALADKSKIDVLGDSPDGLFDVVVRAAGAQAASSGVAGQGAPLVAAYAGSRFARKLAEKIPRTRVMDVFVEAAENPKFMADLLRRPKTVKEQKQLERQLNAWLLQAGLIPDEE